MSAAKLRACPCVGCELDREAGAAQYVASFVCGDGRRRWLSWSLCGSPLGERVDATVLGPRHGAGLHQGWEVERVDG